MGAFLGQVWNGRTFSLAKHYWLFLVVPGVVFSIIEKVIEFRSLSFTPIQNGWVSGILWTIVVIVFVVGYVGLINCARYRGFRGWSAVAVTVTTLSLVAAIVRVIEGFSGNPPDATQQLYEGAASINAQLPKKIDAITTLTRAEYRNNVFTYYYDIEPTAYQSPNWSADRMKQIVKTNACGTFTGSLGTSALLSVRYVYNTGGRDNIVIDVGEKDCTPAR